MGLDFDFALRHSKIDYDQILSELPFLSGLIFSRAQSQQSLWIAQEAQRRGLKLIYDIDDYLWDLPSYLGRRDELNFRDQILAMVDCITTPSRPLQSLLAAKFPQARLVFVDNPGECHCRELRRLKMVISHSDVFRLPESREQLFVVLDQLGRDMEMVLEVYYFGSDLPTKRTDTFNLQVVFMGLRQLPHYRRWLSTLKADLALVLLPEDHFSKFKSVIKFAEYAFSGTVGIFSDVEPYRTLIRHGENGYFLKNEVTEWEKELRNIFTDYLVNHNRLRDQALDEATANFGLQKFAQHWSSILKGNSLHNKIEKTLPFMSEAVVRSGDVEAYQPTQARLELYLRQYALLNHPRKLAVYLCRLIAKKVLSKFGLRKRHH